MKKLLLALLTLMISVGYSSNVDKTSNYSYGSREVDSLDQQINPLMKKKEFQQASSLMLEKGKLLFGHGMYINASTVLESAIDVLNQVDEKERDNTWSDLYVECLNWEGVSLSYISSFDEAIECYIAIEKYNDNKNNKYAAKAYNGMGIVFSMNNNNTLSEEYYKKALSFAKKVNNYNLFPIYSNLGAMFLNKQEFDSAMVYFLDAQKMAILQKDTNKEVASLQSLALVNSKLKKSNLALRYYNEACDIAIKDNNYWQLSFIKSNMVNFYLMLEDYSSAFITAKEALKLAKQTGSIDLEAKSLKQLSQIYEKQGNYKKSLEYLRAGLRISDSMFNHESDDKLLRQKADFELYRVRSEQELIENKFELELANQKISNMVTWLLMLPLILVVYFVSRRLRKQYKINKQLNSRIEDIESKDEGLKGEIELKNNELTSVSLLIAKFDELSYTLGRKLKILKSNLSQQGKDMDIVKEMEELLFKFISEHDVRQFRQCYKQVPSVFYERLDILYPDLTSGEKRLCGLISMDLSTKEISSLMGKSINNIEVTKTRIRKKMKVGNDINLVDILCEIKY